MAGAVGRGMCTIIVRILYLCGYDAGQRAPLCSVLSTSRCPSGWAWRWVWRVGLLLAYFVATVHRRDTAKVLIILRISFLLVAAEDALTTADDLLGVDRHYAARHRAAEKERGSGKRLSVKYGKLWVGSRGVPVCAGGRIGAHRLSEQGRRTGPAFDRMVLLQYFQE